MGAFAFWFIHLIAFLTLTTACPSNTYVDGSTCKDCNINCQTCSGSSASQCLTCWTGFSLTTSKSCVRTCEAGMYVDANNACLNCSTTCLTCYGSEAACTSCASPNYLSSSTCVSQCPESTFSDSSRVCSPCHSTCLSCSGSLGTQCLTCKPAVPYLSAGSCVAVCPKFVQANVCVDSCSSGYYNDATTCKACNAACQECDGATSSNCTKCKEYRYKSQCIASCPASTYVIGKECFDCNASCKTCTGSAASDCLTCADTSLYLNTETKLCVSACTSGYLVYEAKKQCVRTCPSGTFVSSSTCLPCNSNCLTCASAATTCTNCVSNLYLSEGKCLTFCPSRTYVDGNICKNCHFTCITCRGTTETDCIVCSASTPYYHQTLKKCYSECPTGSYTLGDSCYSDCPIGKYGNANTEKCEDCSDNCLTCRGIASSCSTCQGSFLYKQSCLVTCPSGTFADKGSQSCFECDAICETCAGLSAADCLTCSAGYYLNMVSGSNQCVTSCPLGTYPSSGKCLACSDSCEQCEATGVCILCTAGKFMDQTTKTCSATCKPGEIRDTSRRMCGALIAKDPVGKVSLTTTKSLNLRYGYSLTRGLGTIKLSQSSSGVLSEVWSVSVLDTSSIIVSGDLFMVALPSKLLVNATTYAVEIPAGAVLTLDGSTNQEISGNDWTFTPTASSLLPLYAVLNGRQKSLEIRTNATIELDASGSYDPDASLREGDLEYSWACADYTDSYLNYRTQRNVNWGTYVADYVSSNDPLQQACSFWDYQAKINATTLSVKQGWIADQVLRMDFSIADKERRSSASIYVRFISPDAVDLYFVRSYAAKTSADRPLKLEVKLNRPDIKYSLDWAVKGPNAPIYLTPLSGTSYLTVAENSLIEGGSYTFTLSYSDSVNTASAVLAILVNTPPTGGLLTIDKTAGLALVSSFKGKMLSWSDTDLPLSYSYSYSQATTRPTISQAIQGSAVSEFILSSQQRVSEFSLTFPSEAKLLIGYCSDALGSSAVLTQTIQIETIEDLTRAKNKADSIETPTSYATAIKATGEVASISAEIAALGSSSDASSIKSKLLSVLEVSVSQAGADYSLGKRKQAAILYRSILTALEPLSRQPLVEANLGSVLTLASSIDVSRLQAFDEVQLENSSTTFTTSQEALSTVNLLNVAQMLAQTLCNLLGNTAIAAYSAQANILLGKANKVLGLNSQISELPRFFNFTEINAYSRRGTVSSFENSVLSFENSVKVTVPPLGFAEDSVLLEASVVKSNLVQSSQFFSLGSSLQITFREAFTEAEIPVKDLPLPFLFDFNVTSQDLSRLSLQVSAALGSSRQIWPECTYLDPLTETWVTEGCSLVNIAEAYDYFSVRPSEAISIQCACTHLSEFSVGFRAVQSAQASSYIIRDDEADEFEFSDWEDSIPIYVFLVISIAYLLFMSFACYWDYCNTTYGLPSIEADKVHNYFDPEKVETVLKQLESAFIKQRMDTNKSNDPSAYVVKVLNSDLIGKLKNTYAKTDGAVAGEAADTSSENKSEFELMMTETEHQRNYRTAIEVNASEQRPRAASIEGPAWKKLKSFIDKPLDDVRFHMMLPGDTGDHEPTPTRHIIKETIEKLQHRLYLLNNRYEYPSKVDEFLSSFDSCNHLSVEDQQFLHLHNRELRPKDLKRLGYRCDENEFEALRVSGATVAPDPYKLTGGKYAKKLIDDVDEFYYTLKVSYVTLFSLFFKKEHKVVSLFYSLHIEYTKKAMLSFLFLHTSLQLLFTQLYILKYDWGGDTYTDSNTGVCVWGCIYEGQILAGFVCASLPWPLVYLVKYLWARNSIEYGASHEWK